MQNFADCKFCQFLITSDVVCFNTHFVGRTIVCPGRSCKLCGFERPRLKHYCLAVHVRVEQLVEMCESLYAAAVDAMNATQAVAWPGVIARCKRTSPRRAWTLDASEFRPEMVAQMPEPRNITEWLGDLYRVPSGPPGESLCAWVLRAGEAHAQLQLRALLPGMA